MEGQIEGIGIKQFNYEFIFRYEFRLKPVWNCDHRVLDLSS